MLSANPAKNVARPTVNRKKPINVSISQFDYGEGTSNFANDCFGSLAALLVNSSLMSGFGRKADVQVGQFCENLGDIPECPLFSKADVRTARKCVKLRSAFGQERPFNFFGLDRKSCSTLARLLHSLVFRLLELIPRRKLSHGDRHSTNSQYME